LIPVRNLRLGGTSRRTSGARFSKSAPTTSEPALNISLMWPGVFTTVASSASPSTSLPGSSTGRTTRPHSRNSWGAYGIPKSGATSNEKSTSASCGIPQSRPPREFLIDEDWLANSPRCRAGLRLGARLSCPCSPASLSPTTACRRPLFVPLTDSACVLFRVTKRFRASLPDVFAWCTEFRDNDPELSRVRLRTRKVIRREGDLIEMEETGIMGFPFVSRSLVRLRPPDTWEADGRSNMGHIAQHVPVVLGDVWDSARDDVRPTLEGALPLVRPVREKVHGSEDLAGVGRLCACNAVGSIVPSRNPSLSRLFERTGDKPMDDRVAECQRDGPLQSSMGDLAARSRQNL